MATTGFWPIKGDLKGVVDYARNPEKTTMPDELRKAIDYAGNPDKTECMMFVSAINCPKQRAYECMTDTKSVSASSEAMLLITASRASVRARSRRRNATR